MKKKLNIHKDQYYYTSSPDAQKLYTTNEIAHLLNITAATVRSIAYYHNIEYKVIPTIQSRQSLFTYDAYRIIKEIHETGRAKNVKAAKEQREREEEERSILEEADLHPLVTDKRFLKLGYFPETVPDCFAE